MNRYIALKTIIEYGNFSRAAEVLGYTQPAVSQMVSSLEEELGVKLLQRGRGGATLTEEGKAIYPLIEQTLAANARIREKAQEVQGLETGTVRIASISSVATHWLPPMIRSFCEDHPNIRFQIKTGNFAGILELLRTGLADLAFTSIETAGGTPGDPGKIKKMKTIGNNGPYRTELLKAGRMLAILPQDHPLAEKDVIPLQDLEKERSLLLERGDYHEPRIALADLGIYDEPLIDIENDDHATMAMVEQGLGISILSELMLERTSFNIAIRPTEPQIYRYVGAVYRDLDSLPAAARRFLEHMKVHAEELK